MKHLEIDLRNSGIKSKVPIKGFEHLDEKKNLLRFYTFYVISVTAVATQNVAYAPIFPKVFGAGLRV